MDESEDEIMPLKDRYAEIAAKGLASSAKQLGYSEEEIRKVPEGAVQLGLGCGNPQALTQLRKGQTVLDLGSGAGLDVFIAAQKVGSEGRVIGIDMTPQMVSKAVQYAREGGYTNVAFKVGRIEHLPIADAAIDVIISNCVINHSPDKPRAFREAQRVLRHGGLLLVSDLTVEDKLPPVDSPGLEVWREWLRVACGKDEYLATAEQAGFSTIEVIEECRYTGPAVTPLLAGKITSLQLRMQK